MFIPRTLEQLARWVEEQGLAGTLRRPWQVVADDLGLSDKHERLCQQICDTQRAKTLLDAITNRAADDVLRASTTSEARAAAFVHALFRALVEIGRDDPDEWDDEGYEEDEGFEDDEPAMASPLAVHVGVPRLLIDLDKVNVAPAPSEPEAVRRWAEQYGVTERLSDPARVLQRHVFVAGPRMAQILETHTVGELFALKPQSPPKRLFRWQLRAPEDPTSNAVEAARAYLASVARVRAAVVAHREAIARRSKLPSEPALQALAARLGAAREELAKRVPERALGTFLPALPAVDESPLRIVYAEAVNYHLGFMGARVSISVEEDPIRIVCACGAEPPGECPHALSALEAAISLVGDPENAERRKLVETLTVPAWQRFLQVFGHEVARREAPKEEDARLAWRILADGPIVDVRPVIQKRLKSGAFSGGQQARIEEIARRPGLLADPHDLRVYRVLTAGYEEVGGRAYGRISRARLARVVEALVGHPRVLLGPGAGSPAHIARERLSVALEPDAAGVTVSFLLGGKRWRASDLRDLAGDGGDLVAVDHAERKVMVCSLDARAQALVAAFARQPARFPPESHEELLRGFAALQESVDLVLPEALAGAPVPPDTRPILRLGPRDSGDLEVDVRVRPIDGGPDFAPGEGPQMVFHTADGRRLAARRDRTAEVSIATAMIERLAPGRSGWTFELGEEAALDLVVALREVGDAVVVEWPERDRRIEVTGSAGRKDLRVRVTDRRDWFGVEGEVEVDGDVVPLAALLDAVRRGRRYVRVGPGKYAEIEEELRRRVAAADDVLHAGRHGLEVALPGVGLIADLVEDVGFLQAASRWRKLVARIEAARSLDPEVPEGLRATLRPYQVEGYKWLARLAAWGTGACLADDMGLGKTVQTLALLLARASLGPALVIAPTSVGPTWIREAERFAPGLRARLYRGAERAASLEGAGPGDLFVTSYALAVRDAEALGKVRFGTLVIDEAQAIKNALTRRAKAVRGLDAELRVALTGTPVENHLGELWSLMRVVAPGLLGSWEHFRDRFAGPIEKYGDKGRSLALARLTRPFLLRRTKAEVAPELPARTEIERFVDLSASERRLYDDARREALEAIAAGGAAGGRFSVLAALTRLRRLACHPRLHDERSNVPSSKLKALLEAVEELREEGHRALVFSQFTSHLALVREALDRAGISYEYLDGSTPAEERERRIDAFQGGRGDLFLISLKAGGTGLNLTAADHVIHLDPWWNPAVEDQATDRAHRIGQTRAVTVIRIIARGTIEEAVLSLHADKRALAASIFDEEGGAARLSTEELAALIRAGEAEAPADDEADTAGDELVAGDDGGVARAPSQPPVAATEGAAGTAAEALVEQLIARLAEQRGIADPRHDATLRTYGRALRRFVEYLAAHPEIGPLSAAKIDGIVEGYLAAIKARQWRVPASEQGLARTVTNHLRAFVRERANPPGASPRSTGASRP